VSWVGWGTALAHRPCAVRGEVRGAVARGYALGQNSCCPRKNRAGC